MLTRLIPVLAFVALGLLVVPVIAATELPAVIPEERSYTAQPGDTFKVSIDLFVYEGGTYRIDLAQGEWFTPIEPPAGAIFCKVDLDPSQTTYTKHTYDFYLEAKEKGEYDLNYTVYRIDEGESQELLTGAILVGVRTPATPGPCGLAALIPCIVVATIAIVWHKKGQKTKKE